MKCFDNLSCFKIKYSFPEELYRKCLNTFNLYYVVSTLERISMQYQIFFFYYFEFGIFFVTRKQNTMQKINLERVPFNNKILNKLSLCEQHVTLKSVVWVIRTQPSFSFVHLWVLLFFFFLFCNSYIFQGQPSLLAVWLQESNSF